MGTESVEVGVPLGPQSLTQVGVPGYRVVEVGYLGKSYGGGGIWVQSCGGGGI